MEPAVPEEEKQLTANKETKKPDFSNEPSLLVGDDKQVEDPTKGEWKITKPVKKSNKKKKGKDNEETPTPLTEIKEPELQPINEKAPPVEHKQVPVVLEQPKTEVVKETLPVIEVKTQVKENPAPIIEQQKIRQATLEVHEKTEEVDNHTKQHETQKKKESVNETEKPKKQQDLGVEKKTIQPKKKIMSWNKPEDQEPGNSVDVQPMIGDFPSLGDMQDPKKNSKPTKKNENVAKKRRNCS